MHSILIFLNATLSLFFCNKQPIACSYGRKRSISSYSMLCSFACECEIWVNLFVWWN